MDSTATKPRKVYYDDLSNGYYSETRIEAVQRQCEKNTKIAETRNRSENVRLDFTKRQANVAHHIFKMKSTREIGAHRDVLRDHVAHKSVLHDVAKCREFKADEENFGTYGIGSSKIELTPIIEVKLKHLTPSAKRKRGTKKLLKQRRRMQELDRRLPTPELFKMVSRKKSKVNHKVLIDESSEIESQESMPQLILPPLAATMTHKRKLSEHKVKMHKPTSEKRDSLPAVFVTQTNNKESDDDLYKGNHTSAFNSPDSLPIITTKRHDELSD